MTAAYDAIVVGAGHNGLTAAAYLARAGLSTLVLERRPVVGGTVATETFHPGFRNSVAAYVVSLLRAEVVEDLALEQHGYATHRLAGSLSLSADRHLLLTGEPEHDRAQMSRHSRTDFEAMERFEAMLESAGEVVRRQWLREPPGLEAGLGDLLSGLRLGWEVRGLEPQARHRLLQVFTTPAIDLIERHFESPFVRAMVASHCLSGNFASLSQPGSAIALLHHALGELDGERGAWGLVRGGMGGLSQALAASAAAHGAEIRTEAPVERVVVGNGRVTGVRLEDGEALHAHFVLANTDPKRTFLGLVGREHLDPAFADDIAGLRMGHASLRMNLALKGLPPLAAYPGAGECVAHRCDIAVFPDLDGIEAAYQAARRGLLPPEPRLEVIIPSTLDASLAPPGCHVMSILAKYYPYDLREGGGWDAMREPVADAIVSHLARHMPGLADLVVARQVLTPLDLERVFGLTEGDIFHGRLDLDQIFSLRPHPRAARYRTPVAGLYLCGAGAHPGGGVTGAPGHNAARRVIADFRRR